MRVKDTVPSGPWRPMSCPQPSRPNSAATMQTQIVRPATARLEGVYLLLVCIAVLAVCGALILKRQTKIEVLQLQPYQISAFADLSKGEQGLFNDLYAAALELQTVHRDGDTWLSLDDLQDLAMPPFAQA